MVWEQDKRGSVRLHLFWNLHLQYLTHHCKRFSFWPLKRYLFWILKGQKLSLKLSHGIWAWFIKYFLCDACFKNSQIFKLCTSSLVQVLSPRNFIVFESHFLPEYYSQRAKNFTSYSVFKALKCFPPIRILDDALIRFCKHS